MLLKTRREFTLCFFLFVPLGMAGYCAGVIPADSPAQPTKSESTKSNKRAVVKKGGQPAPQNPGGGLSSTEQLSRLLVDGRRAYRDGEMLTARSYFSDALKLDDANSEAQRYLREIDQKSSGERFSPNALSAQIPAGVAGRTDKVDVVATVNAVKANATPAPVTQSFGGNDQQVSVKGSVSMALDGGSNSFSRPVSIAVSLDDKPAVQAVAIKAEVAKADAPESEPVKPKLDDNVSKSAAPASKSDEAAANDAAQAIGRLTQKVGGQRVVSARELLSEASIGLADGAAKLQQGDAKVVASLDPPAPGAAAKLNLEVDLKAKDKAEADAKAEVIKEAARQKSEKKARDEKAAAEQAKADKAEKLAVAKAEKLAADKAEKEKIAAEKKAAAQAEQEKADREKAEKELVAKEKAEKVKAEKELAAKTAEADREAAEVAAKAEEDRKAAEKKADEARKLADAEKEATEAAAKAETEKKLAQAAADKKLFNQAVSETNEGIKLYNAGKYSDSRKKFELALATQSDYREAQSYLERAERKLEEAKAKPAKEKAAPVLNLDQLKDDLKEVAQASSVAVTETEKTVSVSTSTLTSNGEAAGDASASTDPIVEADKLLRTAQTDLQEGRREQALESVRKAIVLDPKNTSAAKLAEELSSDSVKALPSLGAVAVTTTEVVADVTPATDTVVESTSLDVASPEAPILPPPIGPGPDGVGSLLTEGRSKFESGQLRESLTTFQAVLDKDPANAEAKAYIRKIEVARAGEGGPVPLPSIPGGPSIATAQTAQDAESAFQQGLVAYQAARLDVAVQHWNFALTLDPNHPRAVQYLEQTRSEYEAWVQQHQYNAVELQKEVSSTNKLETAVTYDSAGQKTLVEFLQAMSLITDINFYVADGVDADLSVTAKFDQTVLQDALDIVLLPVGLKWHRTGDVVSVTTDLHNKFYNLTPAQVGRLKPLLENRTLQRYLYGPEGLPPMRNVELLLDDRENLLIVTDSAENLNKIEAFLKDLQVDAPQQLVFKNWKIRPEEGQRIKALVEAIVKVNSDAAWDLDRRVVVDGDDLIVKDSAENVAKIEQLLLDKNFLKKLENQTLGVQSYSLVPREPIGPENVEQARDMAQSIVTVVKTILYSQSGEESAAAEGRRFWYDPNSLQLTITDNPGNLEIVSDYLKSLPTLSSSEQKSEIIFLKHQTAVEMKTLLDQVLGLGAGLGRVGGGVGNSVTKTVRTEGELIFGDLNIRVRRIEGQPDTGGGGGGGGNNQRSAELIVRTATSSQDLTLEEFDTEFVDEYEITAEDIRPSDAGSGEGSVRLRVAISAGAIGGVGFGGGLGGGFPGGGLAGGGLGFVPSAPGNTIAGAITNSIDEEIGIVIENVPNMNALLIRYTNPNEIAEVKDWLEQLDIPVMQVSIETKLVEVNETRAKEFMPELNLANLGQGSPDFSNNSNFFDFAKNDQIGELGRSPFDPFADDTFNNSLLKGTSVFNIITGGESPISFTLRALESEGVLNMTNGPTITVENNELAEFSVSRDFGLVSTSVGGTGDSEQTRVPRINHVNMSVTPQITQAGEIRLEITDLQFADFGNQISPGFPTVVGGSTTSIGAGGPAISGSVDHYVGYGFTPPALHLPPDGSVVPYEVRRRSLTTVARVNNHGTIVLGGWTGERSRTSDSGVPVLRNLPYVGKLLFGRTSDKIDRTNLLIFLTCHLIDP